MKQRFVAVGGLRLHFTDFNEDGGEPIVMLHGLNVQARTWDPVAERLAEHRRVICLDLRGHGLSDWTRDGYSVTDFAADVAGLVDALGLDRVDVVGHSLGCRIGIVFAGAHPERVGRLVLSDTGPEFPRAAAAFSANVVSRAGGAVRGFDDEAAALAYYQEMHPEWQPVFHALHVEHQLRRNWAGKLVFRADPDLFWLLGSAGRRDDAVVWDALDRLTMPTQILWGRRSPFLDDDLARRMLERMADGTVVRTDSGHYIPREAPAEFLAVVSQFLDVRRHA